MQMYINFMTDFYESAINKQRKTNRGEPLGSVTYINLFNG